MEFSRPKSRLWLVGLAGLSVCFGSCHRESVALPVATPTSVAAAPAFAPVEERGPLSIKWEQIAIDIPSDNKYQPWMMTTRVQALDGKLVRIQGFMFAGLLQTSGIKSFPLVKDVSCRFGEDCQPHHAIQVELAGDLKARYTAEPVVVEGQFTIRPWTDSDGKTWSLYHMEVTKMENGPADK